LVAGKKQDDRALAVMAAIVGAVVFLRASEDEALAASIEAAVQRPAAAAEPA
jgi:hypothetical protein